MKSPHIIYIRLRESKLKREWSLDWIKSNWNGSYECGFNDGQDKDFDTVMIFLNCGSFSMAENGWFWYPYMMGLRDALGDIGYYDR